MTVKSRLSLRGVVAAGAIMLGLGAAGAEPIRIGIANFGEHPQLNTAIQGFKDALAAGGYEEGKDVVYSESHTNFDASYRR
jgi:putative ABC transport system substrate-binding protein